MLLASLDVGDLKQAVEYVQTLPPEDKSVVTTWLVFEGLAQITYYILLFAAVFFLGRRIIQAMIAAYREAKAESV